MTNPLDRPSRREVEALVRLQVGLQVAARTFPTPGAFVRGVPPFLPPSPLFSLPSSRRGSAPPRSPRYPHPTSGTKSPLSPPSPLQGRPRPFRPSPGQTLAWNRQCACQPSQWKPTLLLDPELLTTGSLGNEAKVGFRIPLVTLEMALPEGFSSTFLLGEEYQLQGILPRSYFVVMQYNRVQHQLVFEFPDHSWFHDLFGLRKSTYIQIRTQGNTPEVWDLHLKPSSDRSNLFGYLYRRSELKRIIVEQQRNLLRSRRLPLVFDLDDTLVRVVADNDKRYIPEKEAAKIPHRVYELEDGRRVVLGERVREFLEWAHKYFEISVCSLGDPQYVRMVVKVLDPGQTWIKGILYSARQEYNHMQQRPHARQQPPKDLLSLYAFCTLSPAEYEKSMVASTLGLDLLKDNSGSADWLGRPSTTSLHLPLVIDDMAHMWSSSQSDNIIAVRDQRTSGVWDVALYPVVYNVLHYVYHEFFRRLDFHLATPHEYPMPSAVGLYKDYLRGMLREQIGATPTAPRPPSSFTNEPSSVQSGRSSGSVGEPSRTLIGTSYYSPPSAPADPSSSSGVRLIDQRRRRVDSGRGVQAHPASGLNSTMYRTPMPSEWS
ncbi:hypothetical protein IWQ61_009047 [Dispira simplex]|nr:hypothetical protein IWQ61_009047 [Dispira simplex]